MPDASPGLAPRLLVGAAFASTVVTTIPGLALLLGSFDKTAPDMRALAVEGVTAILAATFGALQLRVGGALGKWGAALGVIAISAYALVSGVALDLDLTAGSVDSGPGFIIGLLVVLLLTAITTGVAIAGAILLSRLRKGLEQDEASGKDPRARCIWWLLTAAAVHVGVKSGTGGPVVVGVAAAAVATVLAMQTKQRAAIALGALTALVGASAQAGIRAHHLHDEALARLPFCFYVGSIDGRDNDVLSQGARKRAGVADAVTLVPPMVISNLTLVVLPVGGGALPSDLKDAIAHDAATARCAVDNQGTRANVTVVGATYVPIAFTARIKMQAGADPNVARAAVTQRIREALEPRAGGPRLITREDGGPRIEGSVEDAGIAAVTLRADGEDVETRLAQLARGEVPVASRIDVEMAP